MGIYCNENISRVRGAERAGRFEKTVDEHLKFGGDNKFSSFAKDFENFRKKKVEQILLSLQVYNVSNFISCNLSRISSKLSCKLSYFIINFESLLTWTWKLLTNWVILLPLSSLASQLYSRNPVKSEGKFVIKF